MKKQYLTSLFNQFVGLEVPLEPWELCLEGEDYTGLKPVRDPDPVIDAMNCVAKSNGLELIFWNPTIKESDFESFKNTNTVNVYIDQGSDGKYRIRDKFTMS